MQRVENSPCDPKTLARAARDHAQREPAFALGAALASLRWLTLGYGYEVAQLDVCNLYRAACKAAEILGQLAGLEASIRQLVGSGRCEGIVRQTLGHELGFT